MPEIGVSDVRRNDIVSSVVQEVLKQEAMLLPTITDYSSLAVPGAKSVEIQKRTQFASADKSEGVALTGQQLVFTGDVISLDKHKAIYSIVEKIASLQSAANVEANVLLESAKELALQIDKDIITQLKLVSTAAPDHLLDYANSPTDTIQQTDILEARRLLNVQKVPMQGRFMVIPPDQEKAMLLISDFVRADSYGSAGGLINGEIGRVYGFTVLMHTELSAADALFYHQSHAGFAMQLNPEYSTDVDLSKVSAEYLLHQIYGVKVLDAGKRGVYFNGTGV